MEDLGASVEPGQVLADRLRLEERLGSGAVGEVWRARHLGLGKDVAVKLLRPDHVRDEAVSRRFIREAQTASRLDHPGTVSVLDFGRDASGVLYLAMELVGGPTLLECLRERGALPLSEAAAIISRVLAAVGAAHAAGVLHRDLKPSNILLSPREDDDGRPFMQVKVCDFGLAKWVDAAESLADAKGQGGIVGTPLYMSPEQAVDAEVDERADIYAVGVILFEMLAGQPPYEADRAVSVLMKHCSAPVPSISDLVPSLPRRVDEILRCALAKDPRERFASARAFRAAVLDSSQKSGGPRRSSSDTGYFVRPGATGEHDRVPRPHAPRRPPIPDVAARALLEDLPIESPVEIADAAGPSAPSAPASSPAAAAGPDIDDLVIPPPRLPLDGTEEEGAPAAPDSPPPRFPPGIEPAAPVGPSAPSAPLVPEPLFCPSGFYLRGPGLHLSGPLSFLELARAVVISALEVGLERLEVTVDPRAADWQHLPAFLDAVDAPCLGRATCPVPLPESAARGRLALGWPCALAMRAEMERASGRLVFESSRQGFHLFFELHLLAGSVTHVETNHPALQAPAVWSQEGLLEPPELAQVVAHARDRRGTVRSSAKALFGLDLDAHREVVGRARLRHMTALEDGVWSFDGGFIPEDPRPLMPSLSCALPHLLAEAVDLPRLEAAVRPHTDRALTSYPGIARLARVLGSSPDGPLLEELVRAERIGDALASDPKRRHRQAALLLALLSGAAFAAAQRP